MTKHQGRVVQTIFSITESLVKNVGSFAQLGPDGYWAYLPGESDKQSPKVEIYFRKVEKVTKKRIFTFA